jgi:hypothetical protein
MTARRRLATAVLAVVPVALVLLGNLLAGLAPGAAVPVLVTTPAALIGALLLVRFPRNPVGWALYVQAVSIGVEVTALGWHDAGLPGGLWLLWVASWTWAVGLTGVLVLLPLTFPDGRLPARHWRPVLWLAAVGLAAFVVGNALFPGPAVFGAPNPAGLTAAAPVLEVLRAGGAVAVAGSVLASVVAVVQRFRRARAVERAQLKWFASGALVAALGLAAMAVLYEREHAGAAQIVMGTASTALPLAIAVAIFRYRLYDIDRLVSRAVSYALLSGVLAGVYVGAVLLLSRLLAPVAPGGDLAVAAATIAGAGVFAPARRAIQAAVDRRFNRARYDAAQRLVAFRTRLRDEVGLDQVAEALLSTVERTMQPAGASLWFRPTGASR